MWPDFGGATRAACIDYQSSGTYGEAYLNNTCILSGLNPAGAKWCGPAGCGALDFRDLCPSTAANLSAGTSGLLVANNSYYAPRANASWRSSNQRCALSIAGVQAKGEERGSRVFDAATLGPDEIVARVKALLASSES